MWNEKLKFSILAVACLALFALAQVLYTHFIPTANPSAVELVSRSAVEMQNPVSGWRNPEDSRVSGVSLTPASTATAITAICTGPEQGVFDCYQKFYEKTVTEQGVAPAFSDLRRRYDTDSYVTAMCHPITHIIGNTAAKKYPNVAEAYTQGDSFCWSGYYHGVLESVVAQVGPENIVSRLDSICSGVPGKEKYSFDYYNCIHGLGHGLMAMTETELFDSLKLCDTLTGGWEQTSCYGGVFMENVIVDNKNHFTKYLKPSEPLYPCTAVEERYKTSCYLMQTSYMLKVTGGDFAKVFDLCTRADINYRATCWQSLGRDASGRSTSNSEATKATCELGQSLEARSNCVIGAVKDFISYFHSDVQAKKFCASLSEETRSICLDTAVSYYTTF